MAAALRGFRLTARSCAGAPLSYKCAARPIGSRRVFSTTITRWKSQVDSKAEAEVISKAEEALGVDLRSKQAEMDSSLKDIQNYLDREVDFGPPAPELGPPMRKPKETFLDMGDPEPFFERGGFVEDSEDDITSLAHGELEQHREWRHYARLAAWEMPLLSKLAKPFEPPTADMPLRFRYTTYMGEHHPAEKKVVLEFSPADMPNVTMIQREKFRKLLGSRYNPEEDTVRMSCEMFETQAQNKRYLGDLVDTLLQEARDPTDTFEDVPLDTRHHRFKPKHRFPKEWELTEERSQDLARYRQQMAMKDQERETAGQLVDGIKQIEAAMARPVAQEAIPEMVMAGRGAGGKGGKGGKGGLGKRLTVRR